jgi:hypothetical protein
VKGAPIIGDDVIEHLRKAMVAKELGTDLDWIGARVIDDDKFIVIYRHPGSSRDWGILLSISEISTQYESPTSAVHLAHLALEEIAEPSRVFTTTAPLAGSLVSVPGRVLWRGLDPATPGVVPMRANLAVPDFLEPDARYSASWTASANARPAPVHTPAARRWRVAFAWSFILLGALAVVALTCALAGAALPSAALSLGVMLFAFAGFWSRHRARESERDPWQVDPELASASDGAGDRSAVSASADTDSVATEGRHAHPALALILGGGGVVALGTVVVAALLMTRFGGADPVIRLSVILLAAGYGAVGGLVSSLATVWLVHRSRLVEGDFARVVRATLFASAIGWGVAYLMFLFRQDVYSPAALIGAPAVVSGLVFAGILKRYVPDAPPPLATRPTAKTLGSAIARAIVIASAVVGLAVAGVIFLSNAPNALVDSWLGASFPSLLPQEKVSIIISVAVLILISAVGCSLALGVARRIGRSWLGSSYSSPRVIAASLLAAGWPLVHVWWLTGVVVDALARVSPGASLASSADPLFGITVAGWVALAVGTILVLPDYLDGDDE